jgi:glycosyltransferase involved in cell wall biosynthesis
MRILVCHNYYQQAGGEDQVFADEARLLESRGHQVIRLTRDNAVIGRRQGACRTAWQTIWSRDTYCEARALIRRERPHVVHCTNTFPLISPSIYYAARAEGVPVVQSLHNYRLLCANSLLLRDGHVCESCLGKMTLWRGVLHGCYRQSRAGSAVVAAMVAAHRLAGTWTRAVCRYVAMSRFSRSKFIAGGLPADRIAVKPNFVPSDPGPGTGGGGYAVFVGRISAEKGIEVLLDAWQRLGRRTALAVVGDGPLAGRVRAAARSNPAIRWLGRQPADRVLSILGEASCLVLPSLCYENCPKTLLEAFAKGTPAIVSRRGAMAEMVDEGRTGLAFRPGDSRSLAEAVAELLNHPARAACMRVAARREYESKYTAEANYRALLAIYRDAIADVGRGPAPCELVSRGGEGEAAAQPSFPARDGHQTVAPVFPPCNADHADGEFRWQGSTEESHQ